MVREFFAVGIFCHEFTKVFDLIILNECLMKSPIIMKINNLNNLTISK